MMTHDPMTHDPLKKKRERLVKGASTQLDHAMDERSLRSQRATRGTVGLVAWKRTVAWEHISEMLSKSV